MERYQFINSLAKKAGVNESEARLFAEIFLRKVYELIQPGDAIKLDGIGTIYFARTKFKNNISPEGKDEFAEVIVINDLQLSGNGESKPVIFTLPAEPEIKHNPIDKFFSLSPSKPVVQNSNLFQGDIIIPPTGDALEVLLGSKTEKLLANHKVIKNYVEPGLIVNPLESVKVESKNNFDESLLDDELDSLLLSDIKDEELLKELENIKWELDDEPTENLIDSKKLIEVEKESEPVIEDPIQPVSDLNVSINDSEEKEKLVSNLEELNEAENLNNKETDQSEVSFEPLINNKVSSDKSEFERVKSFSAEFNEVNPESENIEEGDAFQAAIDKVTREIESEENLNENILPGFDNRQNIHNEFVEVIPRSSAYNSNIINVIEAENSVDDEVQSEVSQIDPEEYHRNALKEAAKFVNERRSLDNSKGKKRTIISFVIIILILLVLAASIYVYLKYIKAPESSLNGVNGGGNTATISMVEVIERNYELPVTYPYPASRRNEFLHYDGVDPNIFVVNAFLNNDESENITTETGVTENSKVPIKVDVTSKQVFVRIKNNIYQLGDSFIVQVASFKSKTIVESEALKYNKQGHQTYIEEVEIPARGIWFRLRIGNFTSLTDAEIFSNKMK